MEKSYKPCSHPGRKETWHRKCLLGDLCVQRSEAKERDTHRERRRVCVYVCVCVGGGGGGGGGGGRKV